MDLGLSIMFCLAIVTFYVQPHGTWSQLSPRFQCYAWLLLRAQKLIASSLLFKSEFSAYVSKSAGSLLCPLLIDCFLKFPNGYNRCSSIFWKFRESNPAPEEPVLLLLLLIEGRKLTNMCRMTGT